MSKVLCWLGLHKVLCWLRLHAPLRHPNLFVFPPRCRWCGKQGDW